MEDEALIDQIIDIIEGMLQRGEEIPEQLMNEAASIITDYLQNQARSTDQNTLPPNAQLLWILSGGNPEAFVNYLRTYPDKSLTSLSQNPNAIVSLIERLQQQMPQGAPQSFNGMQAPSVRSSNVESYNYDPQTKKLRVRFHGGGLYNYDGVPPTLAVLFANGAASAKTRGSNRHGSWWPGKNPSVGASLNEYIKKPGFSYQKLA